MSRDLNNNKSLKYEKENIELRRGKVLELDAQGYSQHDIASKLNVSVGLINGDLQYIRAKAKENIRLYIEDKLPEEYNKCLVGLNSILKESNIIKETSEDKHVKLKALALAKECQNARLDLLTHVQVVEDVRKFMHNNKEVKEQKSASIRSQQSQQQEQPQSFDKEEQSEDLEQEDGHQQ